MSCEILKVEVEKKFGLSSEDLTLIIPWLWGELAVRFNLIYTYSQKIQLLGEVCVAVAKDKLKMRIWVATQLEKVVEGLVEMSHKLDRSVKPILFF